MTGTGTWSRLRRPNADERSLRTCIRTRTDNIYTSLGPKQIRQNPRHRAPLPRLLLRPSTSSNSMYSDSQLIELAGQQPAPFLWLLDQFHRRDNRLTPDAMRAIASGLRMPLADVYGTATFYHHLTLGNGDRTAPRVCTGPVCRLRGSEQWLADCTDAHAMACAGRCEKKRSGSGSPRRLHPSIDRQRLGTGIPGTLAGTQSRRIAGMHLRTHSPAMSGDP